MHVVWLLKRRLSSFPAIGSRWIYNSYYTNYWSEVVDHHPFTNEITIIRVRENDLTGQKVVVRINIERFRSKSKPLREKNAHPK